MPQSAQIANEHGVGPAARKEQKDGSDCARGQSDQRKRTMTYLTRFSDAMTLVETALPRAWSSIVSCVSRYFFPKKT